MVTRCCQWCKKDFAARSADVNRGWAKFCSKSCKAKEQEKRTHQGEHVLNRPSSRMVRDAKTINGLDSRARKQYLAHIDAKELERMIDAAMQDSELGWDDYKDTF